MIDPQIIHSFQTQLRGIASVSYTHLDVYKRQESLWSLWPAVLAGTDLVMHAAGWLDGGLTVSFEKFILDLENLAMFQHFLAGFAVDDDALALAAIAEVGPGGHHLGTTHTQAVSYTHLDVYKRQACHRSG